MKDISINTTLDTCGLLCPEPVMLLHKKIRDMSDGDIVELIGTDPSMQRDIPKFCSFLKHKLICQKEREDKYFYYIEKTV